MHIPRRRRRQRNPHYRSVAFRPERQVWWAAPRRIIARHFHTHTSFPAFPKERQARPPCRFRFQLSRTVPEPAGTTTTKSTGTAATTTTTLPVPSSHSQTTTNIKRNSKLSKVPNLLQIASCLTIPQANLIAQPKDPISRLCALLSRRFSCSPRFYRKSSESAPSRLRRVNPTTSRRVFIGNLC